MTNNSRHRECGFTLAEIIISTLLLSLLAAAAFKNTHFAQHAANDATLQMLRNSAAEQRSTIDLLRKRYTKIEIDPRFPGLKCRIERPATCPETMQ